jgi:kynurenine 3-monooxygenase
VISDRGWKALRAAGIHEEIEPITIPVFGRMTHDEKGAQNYLPYSVKKKAIYSVSRGGLNARLIDIAEQFPNVSYHFNEKCIGADFERPEISFENSETKVITSCRADVVFGADGANSIVRKTLQNFLADNKNKTKEQVHCNEHYIEHGYKELVIPPNEDKTWKLDKSALHIWPRKQFMLMALANLDGGFTCTLFFPIKGARSFESIKTGEDLMGLFEEVFPDAIPLMPSLEEDYFSNSASNLLIVKCNPWTYKGKAALIGDAAHAIVPFYGEGMNCGFEDCEVLNNLLGQHDGNWQEILDQFGKLRKPNGDAIADLSLRNFIEMRDLVADPRFLLRKKIESKIHSKFPEQWVPLYSQVKFSNIPYSEALKKGQDQDKIMEAILSIKGIENAWDSEEMEQEILKKMGL